MATIQISDVNTLEALINGDYGFGTSAEPLDVELTNDIDFSLLSDSDARKWSFKYNDSVSSILFMDFNGNGHSIKNFAYNNSGKNWGLFYGVSGSIQSVTLSDFNITCKDFYAFSSSSGSGRQLSLIDCIIKGWAVASNTFGGLANGNQANTISEITRCAVIGTFSGATVYGLNGSYGCRNISMSYVSGTLSGNNVYIFTQNSTNGGTANNSFFRGRLLGALNNVALCRIANYCYMMVENATSLSKQYNLWNAATCSFYNNDDFDYGAEGVDTGTSKANLRNASWLREQGFPI